MADQGSARVLGFMGLRVEGFSVKDGVVSLGGTPDKVFEAKTTDNLAVRVV